MVCLYCDTKLVVINSRPQKRTNSVWRRRSCPGCNIAFTSLEEIDPASTLVIKDSSGRLQPFSRDKLFLSVYKSCRHRMDPVEDARALTATIVARLGDRKSPELTRRQVIKTVAKVLGRFDSLAAMQYEAYHKKKAKAATS